VTAATGGAAAVDGKRERMAGEGGGGCFLFFRIFSLSRGVGWVGLGSAGFVSVESLCGPGTTTFPAKVWALLLGSTNVLHFFYPEKK
jgi:hypothetical protein